MRSNLDDDSAMEVNSSPRVWREQTDRHPRLTEFPAALTRLPADLATIIRQNPLSAVCLGGAAGMLLGGLVKRSR